MRSKPWANSFTNTTTIKQTKVDTMETGVKLPPLNPLSQIDCLAPDRADEKAIAREQEASLAKIRCRQKRIIKPENKEREFEFGRRRKRRVPEFREGAYPPLSQVPMGNNPILDIPTKKTHHSYKRNVNTTRLIPISQISCLIDTVSNESRHITPPKSSSKFHINDEDSTYVKLAKSGGQPNLLHYIEAKPPLKRSIDTNYSPSSNGLLPALKSKSVQDPTWKPSDWSPLPSIKKKEDDAKEKSSTI